MFEVTDYESLFQILKFKMADQNVKIYLIAMKISTRGFQRSLIKNFSSTFKNSE